MNKETYLDRCDRLLTQIVNGNKDDARRLLKSYSRKDRYLAIDYIKSSVSESTLWYYIKICIEGDFK